MSTDAHNTKHASGQPPVHDDVAFEARDVKVSGVLKFLVFLGITLVFAYFICLRIYNTAMARVARFDAPPPAVRQQQQAPLPPEPRLQAQGLAGYHDSDPQQDLRDKLKQDREALEQARWVDEKAGVAQIPVEDAMKIIVEKGLPAVPPVPAAKKK